MRTAEYKKIDTRVVYTEVVIPTQYDDDGNIISEERIETIQKEVPVMGMVYRDATPEEITEFERQQAELPKLEPYTEERFDKLEQRTDTLESATDDLILMMADLIGG